MYNVGPRGVLYKQKYVFFVCGDISPIDVKIVR